MGFPEVKKLYQALYRTWRPKTFDDVISQSHITTALQHQLRDGKTAHAYLFTGSRGTGKTTCARILAKAVNCLHPNPDGSPCLTCDICKDAERGALSDIVEIDAASNNSVDDVRDLREGTVYLPERCRYKVYIIDEVHMLSASAWGALLKVMEEPPEYVKFILATTEVHKVPATIVSRCQRYDFHRIRTEDIAARLRYIAKEENIPLEPDGADMLARLSDGGMRDGLSLLDQCAGVGEPITAELVTRTAGVAGREHIFSILEALENEDGGKALTEVGTLYDQSKDMVRLCDEILEQLRNMMLLKSGAGGQDLLTCLPDEVDSLRALTDKISLQRIFSWIHALQDCRERMQNRPGKRVELEMTLLRMAVPERAAAPTPVQPAAAPQQTPRAPEPEPQAPPVQQRATQNMGAEKTTNVQPFTLWPEVLEAYQKVNPAVSGCLSGSTAYTSGDLLLIVTENPFFLQLLKKPENAQSLGQVLHDITGVDYKIRAKCTANKKKTSKAQDLLQKAKDEGIETKEI